MAGAVASASRLPSARLRDEIGHEDWRVSCFSSSYNRSPRPLTSYFSERVTRIELALSAWEADVLPLNYTRATCGVVPYWRPAQCLPRHRTGTGRLPGCCSPIVTLKLRSSPGGSSWIPT